MALLVSDKILVSEEEILWQAFKAGDRNAFSQLLKTYYPILLSYGVRFQQEKDYVKDCLHDFFVELWNRRENLDDVQCLKAYLLQSFRRRILREKSKDKWFREIADLDQEYCFEVQFNIETYLIENEVKHEHLQKLHAYLKKLSKREQEVIYLRFYEELDYAKIADIMSIKNHSAVNLVHEALKHLRNHWFLVVFASLFN